jgi:hypothetical protein
MELCARVPSPFRFTPRRAECGDFSGASTMPTDILSLCARPKTLFHNFAAVGGVSRLILQSPDQ